MPEVTGLVIWWVGVSTVLLGLGLVLALVWRRHPARAHRAILLSMLAVLVAPVLHIGVGVSGLGVLPSDDVPPDHVEVRHDRPASFDGGASGVEFDRPVEALTASPLVGSTSRNPVSAVTLEVVPPEAAADPWSFVVGILVVGWVMSSVVVLCRVLLGVRRDVCLVRSSEVCEEDDIVSAIESARRSLGIRRVVEARCASVASCPVVWTFGRACVIVPSKVPGGIDWRGVMVHELGHVRRRDHESGLVGALVCIALPWHPLAWWSRTVMASASERACDDLAIGQASSDASYAGSLLAFASGHRGLGSAPAIVSGAGVGGRIERVLSGRPGRVVGVRLGAALCLGVSLASSVASLAQPGRPVEVEPPSDEGTETIESFLAFWDSEGERVQRADLARRARALVSSVGSEAIPTLIGVIDADESPLTIYGVGHFALSEITGVRYSPYHDGGWWRRWWASNKDRFPGVSSQEIPVLEETSRGLVHVPYPEELSTLDGKLRWLLKEYDHLRAGETSALALSSISREIAAHGDPRAIPTMIGVIDADNSYDTVYGVGYFGLSKLTGVDYSPFHDGAWWRRWWASHRSGFDASVRALAIPDLPKSAHGATYQPFPEDLLTFEGLVRQLREDYDDPGADMHDLAEAFVDLGDDRAIPEMIGAIDADNSYDTVYGLGYFGLGEFTDVRYSPYHDGAWWRRWWASNKERFSASAQAREIPDLPKSAHGRTYEPMPESFETLGGKVAWTIEAMRSGRDIRFGDLSQAIASHEDARAIPFFIGLMEADTTGELTYDVGYFGMRSFAPEVEYDESHDGAWWRRWWMEHRADFTPEAREAPIPDLSANFARWVSGKEARERARLDARFAGYPSTSILVDGDDRKRYFLFGPAEGAAVPESGWKVLLILPGGDGSAAFESFGRTIRRDALPEGFIAAQLVAPVWSGDRNRTVWPTGMLNPQGAAFTTETFIRDVVKDLESRHRIDRSNVLALGWSSSGPALYCESLQEETPVTGWFIAMSVFRPAWMPSLERASGKRYYILHSPDETMIPIDEHAREAVRRLDEAGASVTLTEYAGGHGWREDPIGHIRRGVDWLLAR